MVPMTDDRSLTIHFLDGSEMSLAFPRQQGNPLLLAKRIQEALDANHLAIEAEGELLVFPKTGIKYLKMSPLPDELPETIIRGAKIL